MTFAFINFDLNYNSENTGLLLLKIFVFYLETLSCAKCTVRTVNQETKEKGEELFKILSQYRLSERKIWFGRYFKLIDSKDFTIAIGDEISVT
ncbi:MULTISPECIES: MOSC domain-containing protein [Aquimarina]|uniref:MOSC domain-containing protein n=1 Tax=Aquimarina TaxID=290174 RepID=UPI0009441970|nr:MULTISPECIES: MOSC domain-containing protein [Aquimarina]